LSAVVLPIVPFLPAHRRNDLLEQIMSIIRCHSPEAKVVPQWAASPSGRRFSIILNSVARQNPTEAPWYAISVDTPICADIFTVTFHA
jgi:hypothetical protein